jgi:hypothetical protein
MRWLKIILPLLGLVLLVGCQQAANQSLPTIMPTAAATTEVGAETAVPTTEATQPPLDRPTLPPTWTVSPVPTEAPTSTVDLTSQSVQDQPTLVVCGTFAVDRERSPATFTPGNPVQVYWTAVDTAARYRISLIDEQGLELVLDYTREPTYTFPGELFERGKRYAWSVYPEDAINQQMCFERGAEILPV